MPCLLWLLRLFCLVCLLLDAFVACCVLLLCVQSVVSVGFDACVAFVVFVVLCCRFVVLWFCCLVALLRCLSFGFVV